MPYFGRRGDWHSKGVLIRSRLKPNREIWSFSPLYLQAYLSCLPIAGNNPVFRISTIFGRRTPYPPILYDKDYSTLGIGDKDSMIRAIKNSTESAVTDYIQENFIKD